MAMQPLHFVDGMTVQQGIWVRSAKTILLLVSSWSLGCYPPTPSSVVDSHPSQSHQVTASRPIPRELKLKGPKDELVWAFRDIAGKTYEPWTSPKTRAIVLVFVTTDCPIANYFQPALAQFHAEFGEQVPCFQIHTDIDVTPDKAKQHAEEFQISSPVILDHSHTWATRLDATVSPEAFLISRDGAVIYQGRINDLFTDFGKRRAHPTRNDLRDAVHAWLEGGPIEQPRTKAIGCPIDRHPHFAEE